MQCTFFSFKPPVGPAVEDFPHAYRVLSAEPDGKSSPGAHP